MGCDIHVFTEIKPQKYNEEGLWFSKDLWEADLDVAKNPEDYPELANMPTLRYKLAKSIYESGRDYTLFGILAGVRNDTFDAISKPKGINTQISYHTMGEIIRMGSDGHSHSYLTLAELKAYDWHKVQHFTERVSKQYKEHIEENPQFYREQKNISFSETDSDEQYLMSYEMTPAGTCPDFYEKTIPALEKIKEENAWYGLTDDDVRIVFFFDN